jgi:tryptophan synthase alpha chain
MMSYFNPVYNYGCEDFCRDSADAGIDGLIIPDLPPEEGSDLEVATMKNNLDLVYLLAPTSNPNRIKLVANKSRGFIYLVSVTGTTGAREILPSGLDTFVSRVREIARQPLCVGFGISTPQQARQIATIADGIIVGSRIIQLMESSDDNFASVQDFIVELRNALDNPSAT